MKRKEKIRREKRKEYLNRYLQTYYASNRESLNLSKKAYYEEHKEEVKRRQKIYREEHKAEIEERHKNYVNSRRKNDPIYRLKMQSRQNIWQAFRRKSYAKDSEMKSITGVQCDELCDYLLSTFESRYGKPWDGVEEVHIDHIVPLSTAHSVEEVKELCHYTNLQLLTAKDNLKKSDKQEELYGNFTT